MRLFQLRVLRPGRLLIEPGLRARLCSASRTLEARRRILPGVADRNMRGRGPSGMARPTNPPSASSLCAELGQKIPANVIIFQFDMRAALIKEDHLVAYSTGPGHREARLDRPGPLRLSSSARRRFFKEDAQAPMLHSKRTQRKLRRCVEKREEEGYRKRWLLRDDHDQSCRTSTPAQHEVGRYSVLPNR